MTGIDPNTVLGYPNTPMCDMLSNHIAERNGIVEFIDWLAYEKGYELGAWEDDRFYPANPGIQRLAHEFLGIDENKLEAERREILAYVAGLNA